MVFFNTGLWFKKIQQYLTLEREGTTENYHGIFMTMANNKKHLLLTKKVKV
jgi:hypothetical protein